MAGMASEVSLTAGKRILFLTKDLDLIRKQLYEGLNLRMEDLDIGDLLDDINTDVMTPAWVCFDHDPAMIAKMHMQVSCKTASAYSMKMR